MISLRQLRYDLVGVRLEATSTSLWNSGVLIAERANRAINDAIGTYEFTVQQVYTSLLLATTTQVVALPMDVGRIIRIEPQASTLGGSKQLNGWRHVPTPQTNLLYVDGVPNGAFGSYLTPLLRANVIYETKAQKRILPPDLAVVNSLGKGVTTVSTTGGTPAAWWPSPGFFEVTSPLSTTDNREFVGYEVALPTGFTGLRRGLGGHQASIWGPGAIISAVFEAPPNAMPVIMAKAQASMYEFWVRGRALYNQYTAIASEQQMSVEDLLTMSRAFEDKADRAYRRIKTPPQPTTARSRIRRS